MQTVVYQCDTAMPAQKLPNCCHYILEWFRNNGNGLDPQPPGP